MCIFSNVHTKLIEIFCIIRKKKEIRDNGDKQWSEIEVDVKIDNDSIKNGDDKSMTGLPNNVTLDDSLPKINPVKWTVCICFNTDIYFH
jgi:hypothetical protein